MKVSPGNHRTGPMVFLAVCRKKQLNQAQSYRLFYYLKSIWVFYVFPTACLIAVWYFLRFLLRVFFLIVLVWFGASDWLERLTHSLQVHVEQEQTANNNRTYNAVAWNVWPFHCQSDAIEHDENKYDIVERLPRNQATAQLPQPTLAMSMSSWRLCWARKSLNSKLFYAQYSSLLA